MTTLRSRCGRVLLLLIAGAAAIAATAPTAAMAAVSSDRGGPITRSEVIWRAQSFPPGPAGRE